MSNRLVDDYFIYDKEKDAYICQVCEQSFDDPNAELYLHARAHKKAGIEGPAEKGGQQMVKPEEGSKKQKNMQYSIIERMIKDGSLKLTEDQFYELYNTHRKSVGGGINRFEVWRTPFNKKDLQMLKDYLNEQENLGTLKVAERYGLDQGNFYTRMLRLSVRILFQHPEFLEQLEKQLAE